MHRHAQIQSDVTSAWTACEPPRPTRLGGGWTASRAHARARSSSSTRVPGDRRASIARRRTIRGSPPASGGIRAAPSACVVEAGRGLGRAPGAVADEQVLRRARASARGGSTSRSNGWTPAGLAAGAEAVRVPIASAHDQDPPLRPPQRDLPPPAPRTGGRSRNGAPGSAPRHDVVRYAEPRRDAGAVAVVPVEQLHDAGGLAERLGSAPRGLVVDDVDEPDATVDRERVRRAPTRSSSSQPTAPSISSTLSRRLEPGERLLEQLLGCAPRTSRRRSSTNAGTASRPARRPPASTPRRDRGSARRRGRPRRPRPGSPPPPRLLARARRGRRCSSPPPSRRPSAGRATRRAGRARAPARRAAAPHRVRDDLRMRVVVEPARGEEAAVTRSLISVAVARQQPLAGQPSARVLGVQVEREPLTGRRTGARATRPSAGPRGRTVRCSRSRSRDGVGWRYGTRSPARADRRSSRGGGSAARLAARDEHRRRRAARRCSSSSSRACTRP